MYRLYGALLRLAWAAVLPYQTVIALMSGRPRPRLGEKLGRPGNARSGGIWVHAVSVGEVRLAQPLIARLREILPGLPIHLTTSTEPGRALAQAARDGRAAGGPDSVSELPFDLPASMGRLLELLKPRAVVVVETELWPNLLRVCGERGVAVILVNGRISLRAYPRYRFARRLIADALSRVRLLGMQSEDDAARIRSLGAPAERVRVTGNLKYDLPMPDLRAEEARRRLGIAPGQPLFVAGSTAPAEVAPVLLAFAALRRINASARLALAPRHPESFTAAEEALVRAGLRTARYSFVVREAGAPPAAYDALLIDVLGVLPEIYAAADLVFVGGSLVRRGGQNMLEPAALGKPVLFGPHVENFQAAASALTSAGAAFTARDGAELARLASRLLQDPAASRAVGAKGRQVVEANRGALARTVQMIGETLARESGTPAGPNARRVSAAGA